MSKFKVFGSEPSKPVLFQLREKEGRLNLFAVTEDGKKIPGGHILRIDGDGIHRMNGCPANIGLSLTSSGRLTDY